MRTLGVDLISIANALDVSLEITAGEVISRAYFGDKISPLSETINLAPAMAGVDSYTYIKIMGWTTAALGFQINHVTHEEEIEPPSKEAAFYGISS